MKVHSLKIFVCHKKKEKITSQVNNFSFTSFKLQITLILKIWTTHSKGFLCKSASQQLLMIRLEQCRK